MLASSSRSWLLSGQSFLAPRRMGAMTVGRLSITWPSIETAQVAETAPALDLGRRNIVLDAEADQTYGTAEDDMLREEWEDELDQELANLDASVDDDCIAPAEGAKETLKKLVRSVFQLSIREYGVTPKTPSADICDDGTLMVEWRCDDRSFFILAIGKGAPYFAGNSHARDCKRVSSSATAIVAVKALRDLRFIRPVALPLAETGS